MNYEFKKDQFSEDVADIAKFFLSFVKSFGPSEKKLVDRPIGIFEAMHIRFRLSLVEMGISKIIRTVIALVVGIIVYFTLFRYAAPLFKVIIGGAFLIYYIWLLAPNLAEDMKWKDGKITGKTVDGFLPKHLITIYNKHVDYKGVASEKMTEFSQEVKTIFSPKKSE